MILARVRVRLATTDQCARHFRCFGAGVKKIKKGRGRRIHSIYNGLAVDELSGSQSWNHLLQKSGNIPEVIRDLALCHRGFPERFSEVAGLQPALLRLGICRCLAPKRSQWQTD